MPSLELDTMDEAMEDQIDGEASEDFQSSGDSSEFSDEAESGAPTFPIPSRTLSAVEHPFVVMNIDKAIKTFGKAPQFQAIIDSSNPQLSVPLYLHPDEPTSRPLMSHYAPSHNILLKITVPKRTGRKRKRGSDEPFQGPVDEASAQSNLPPESQLRSRSKLDDPKVLRRKLQDNVGRYRVAAVGLIKHTHRYRGMSDFQYSMKTSSFMNDFTDKVLSGDVAKFRQFSLKPGTDQSQNVDIIPPPILTHLNISWPYNYAQNPYVRAVNTEDGSFKVVNVTSRLKSVGFFIGMNDPTPNAPAHKPRSRDPNLDAVIKAMKNVMEERPVWTRRSMINRIGTVVVDPKNPEKRLPPTISQQLIRTAIQFVGYQFKGGPFRDSLVRYGFDPRTDPSCRIYQTMIFRLRRMEVGQMGEMWQTIRRRDIMQSKANIDEETLQSHIFDGKTYNDDGKVWQVCDITDPLLARLLADAPVRPMCDTEASGWYHRGLWAKARAIMKCKMRAMQFGRELKDSDFQAALNARDESPDPEETKTIGVPLPDLNLTNAELETIRGKRYKGVGRRRKPKRTSYMMPAGTGSTRPYKDPRDKRPTNPASPMDENSTEARPQVDGTGVDGGRGVMQPDPAEGVPDDWEEEDGSEYDEDEGEDEDDLDAEGVSEGEPRPELSTRRGDGDVRGLSNAAEEDPEVEYSA